MGAQGEARGAIDAPTKRECTARVPAGALDQGVHLGAGGRQCLLWHPPVAASASSNAPPADRSALQKRCRAAATRGAEAGPRASSTSARSNSRANPSDIRPSPPTPRACQGEQGGPWGPWIGRPPVCERGAHLGPGSMRGAWMKPAVSVGFCWQTGGMGSRRAAEGTLSEEGADSGASTKLSERLLALVSPIGPTRGWSGARELGDALAVAAAAWNDVARPSSWPARMRLESHLVGLGSHAVEEEDWEHFLKAFEALRLRKQHLYPADLRVVRSLTVTESATGFNVTVMGTAS